ncbi:MAG: PEP-CTERM sorting domain-containing protein [Planctomycetales bacterium]|nr:PEP-CTERM sorting domain-containing protein [Planctomycetales bacterium]
MFIQNYFRSIAMAVACCAAATCGARTWSEGIAAVQGTGRNTMTYRYYLPQNYDPDVAYPLVLFLHGAGERGSDNVSQVANHIAGLIDQTYSQYPAILVAPQAPASTNWYTSSTRGLAGDVLDRIIADFHVDADRMYLTGLSMGGFGTIDYLDYYTHIEPGRFKFAAAVPMSSGISFVTDLSQIEPWQDTPIWLIHGAQDTTVPVEQSRDAFRSYSGLGPLDPIDFNSLALSRHPTAVAENIRYTEVVRGGHVIWSPFYNSNELYDWMFSQSLAVPEPSSILLFVAGLVLLRLRVFTNVLC